MSNYVSKLPPEVLQHIFGYVPFYDLLHCQRVCDEWRTFLPGNDPSLQRRTFSKANVADASEGVDVEVFITTDTWYPSWLTFQLAITLRYRPDGIELHPILTDHSNAEDPSVRADSVVREVIPPYLHISGESTFSYTTNGLRSYIWHACEHEKAWVSNGVQASWEQMFLCVPAVQQVKVTTRRPNINRYHNPECLLSVEEGASRFTIGQVMQVVKEELELGQDALRVYR